MGTATSNLRAATAARAARTTHIGVLTGTDAAPGTEITGNATYPRVAATWPTTDTDGDWSSAPAAVKVARTSAPTLWGGYTAATGGELVEWGEIENPKPTGVDEVTVTARLESLV